MASNFAPLLQATLRICLIAGVFLTLLFLDPLSVQGFREPKIVTSLFLAGIAAVIGSFLAFHNALTGRNHVVTPAPLIALLPLLGLLLSKFFRNNPEGFSHSGNLQNQFTLYILAPAFAWVVFVYCASNAFRSVRSRRILAASILLALAVEVSIVFLEIIQNHTGIQANPISFAGEINLLGQELREKIYGTIGNPNFVAGYLAIAIFPVLGWTISTSSRASGTVGVVVLSASSLAILATRSKGAILALAVGAGQFLFLVLRNRQKSSISTSMEARRTSLLGPLILLGVVVLLVGWMLADQSAGPEEGTYLHHWLETISMKGDSIAVRALLAECGFQMWESHPWTGLGAGQFKVQFLNTLEKMLQGTDADLYAGRVARLQSLRANHLHNEYLQILVEWGIVGLVSVLLFLAWSQVVALTAIDNISSRRDHWVRIGLLSGFWAALGGSLFDLPFHRPSQAFLLALLLGASLSPNQFHKNIGRSTGRRVVSVLVALMFFPLALWLLHDTAKRYVSMREVFIARSILEGKIPAGDTGKATEILQRAVLRVPGEGDYHFYLAHAQLHARKDPNTAITTIRRAQLISDEPELYLLEARAHIEKGNFSTAEPILAFMNTLDHDRPGLHYLLGRVYQGRKHLDDARMEYLAEIRFREGDSTHANPDLEDSLLRLASLLDEASDFHGAVRFYEKFLARKEGQIPNYPLAQINLARIFRDHLFDLDLTRKYLNEALGIFQKNGNTQEIQKIEEELRGLSSGLFSQPKG